MKIISRLISCATALALAMTADAGVFIGYQMDTSDAESCGWFCNYSGPTIRIEPKNDDSFDDNWMSFQTTTGTSSRSAINHWGLEALASPDARHDGSTYYVSFDFRIQPSSSSSHKQEPTGEKDANGNDIMRDVLDADGNRIVESSTWSRQNNGFVLYAQKNAEDFKLPWWDYDANKHWLFSLNEVEDCDANPDPVSNPVFYVKGDEGKRVQLKARNYYYDTYYTFEATIDTLTRILTYRIVEVEEEDNKTILEGTRTIDATVPILPTGLYAALQYTNASFDVSNLIVGKLQKGTPVPNTPMIRLIKVDGESRIMRAFCMRNDDSADETIMHFAAEGGCALADADGVERDEIVIPYSAIKKGENTFRALKSGEIIYWTTIGDLASDKKTMHVDCGAIPIPTPTVTCVRSYGEYSKTYTISADNYLLPTKPTIHHTYFFNNKRYDGLANEAQITIDGPGVLRVRSYADGFENSEMVEIKNTSFYATKADIDFEHMTSEEIMAHGFTGEKTTQTWSEDYSGLPNWTSRGGMYDYIDNGEGETRVHLRPQYKVSFPERHPATSPSSCYPIGADHEWLCGCTGKAGNDEENFINIYKFNKPCKEIEATEAANAFPYLILPNQDNNNFRGDGDLNFYEGVGILYDNANVNSPRYGIQGLKEGEFANIYETQNYGRNSTHLHASTIEEAKAGHHGILTRTLTQDGEFDIFRISNALTRVVILSEDKTREAQLKNEDFVEPSSYRIPDGTESIGTEAFAGVTGLSSITVPYSVKYIYEGAFCGCPDLKEIVFLNPYTYDLWVSEDGVFHENSEVTVFVPNRSAATYRNALHYDNVKEMPATYTTGKVEASITKITDEDGVLSIEFAVETKAEDDFVIKVNGIVVYPTSGANKAAPVISVTKLGDGQFLISGLTKDDNVTFEEVAKNTTAEKQTASRITVNVTDGHVEVSGASAVAVYDMAGHKVKTSAVLPQGLYVVVADGERHLIMVK